jgi:hypothetical protein
MCLAMEIRRISVSAWELYVQAGKYYEQHGKVLMIMTCMLDHSHLPTCRYQAALHVIASTG